MDYSTRRFVLNFTLCYFVLVFFSPFSIAITSLEKELILVLFVRLFDLHLFGFVSFLFLLVSEKGCGLWLWHSLDFSLTYFLLLTLLRRWFWFCLFFVWPCGYSLWGFVRSIIVVHLFGKRELVALLSFELCLVYCLSWIVCSSSWCYW